MLLRSLVIKFFAAFARPNREKQVAKESEHEEKTNGWSVTLSDRTEIKRAAMAEWVKPENIAKRKEENEKAAKESLAFLRGVLGVRDELPVPDPLPLHMRGQSSSTIQAMLRHEKNKDSFDSQKLIVG